MLLVQSRRPTEQTKGPPPLPLSNPSPLALCVFCEGSKFKQRPILSFFFSFFSFSSTTTSPTAFTYPTQ